MSSALDDTPQPGPYAAAAGTYWAAGWRGILPLPARAKTPVPTGWTGARGDWPSYPDVQAWVEDHPAGNIALRLPPDVLGIDVDHYGDKPGGLVLTHLETQLGPLPATWRTTSRDDGQSGIRLYRIPTGLRWPGGLGPGIDTIRHDHRYAVTWPSVHPAGGTYRWITPDGAVALNEVPNVADLPDLPAAWVEHFTRGELSADQPHAGLTTAQSRAWLTARDGGQAPCKHMQSALTRGLADLQVATSRHDAMLATTNRVIWLTGEGHTGGTAALADLQAAFLKATAGDRATGDAEAEWDRMVDGAVQIAAAAHKEASSDPCDLLTTPFNAKSKEKPCATTPCPAPTTSASSTPAPTASAPASSTTTTANVLAAAATGEDTSTTSAPAPASTDVATTDPIDQERTSWWPRNIEAAITGTEPEEPPAFLLRSDGHAAFYRGKVNGIIGPSESGKTWVALHAVTQAVNTGARVTILDFEDTERGVIGRLLALGADPARLRAHVAYISPDEPLRPYQPTGLDLVEHLQAWQPELIVLDGFNAAMTLQGLDLMSNKDATGFAQTVLKPLAGDDTAVIYIDHTPKDKTNESSGGIGAQAKRAMTTGCTLKVDAVKPFGKGQDGLLRLYVDKDRPGHVRGASAPTKGGHWVGDVRLTSSSADGSIVMSFDAPEGFSADAPSEYVWRPTGYMERLAAYIDEHPGTGRNEIVAEVTGKAAPLKKALQLLRDEGWVRVEIDGQKHLYHTVLRYTEASELAGNRPQNNRGPTGVPPGSGTPVKVLGSPGSTGQDVVLAPREPGTRPADPTEGPRTPDPSRNVVERVVGGTRVLINLATGEMTEPSP